MPRRRTIDNREVLPDPVYASPLVEKFICSLMWDGKQNTAQRIFYTSMGKLKDRSQDDPVKVFKKAVENAKPMLEVKTRRVGGANYQEPVEDNPDRRTSLAIRWIVSYPRGPGEKGMIDKPTNEPQATANGRGTPIKNKAHLHRR